MWTNKTEQTYLGVTKEAVWASFEDVPNWTKWHDDVEKMEISGSFAAGTMMRMYLKSGPSPKILLTEVVPGISFTDLTSFPGAKMTDHHFLEETQGGVKITNTVTVTGPLTWLWVKLVAAEVVTSSTTHMDQLVQQLKRDE